jgi:hypothetical protein
MSCPNNAPQLEVRIQGQVERTSQSALAAAERLLADTADAVNPGTPARELLEFVTSYRAHLADLAAACRRSVHVGSQSLRGSRSDRAAAH